LVFSIFRTDATVGRAVSSKQPLDATRRRVFNVIMNNAVRVHVNLDKIRSAAEQIARKTQVDVLAVIKADAYGLGATEVAGALADVVAGFCFFSLKEAIATKLDPKSRKASILLGPPGSMVAQDYISLNLRPAVSTVEQATALRKADPLLCVDAGMQRFACPASEIDRVIAAGGCREAFAHAPTMEQVIKLKDITAGKKLRLHAAASSLLDQEGAWLDAVRPGIALYRDAIQISTKLVEVHDSQGPAGYTGFTAPRFGVILCGYSNGMRKGPCLVNGQPQRVLEVGMQSAFVKIGDKDRVGDEVVLLGDGLEPESIAKEWNCTPHEVIVRLAGSGVREYTRDSD
jgi:alanine racemase